MTTMLDSLFWNKETESSRSVEGEVQSLPFEPPPLSLLRSSRLVRSQQILLLQDYGSFPFTPSFSDGALSLDTVILSFGALHWWTTVTQRVQTHALFSLLRDKFEGNNPVSHVSDGWEKAKLLFRQSMNALGMHTRAHIGSKTVLSMSCEVDDGLARLLSCNYLSGDSDYPWHAQASLLRKLGSHDLVMRTARNDRAVDRRGRYWNIPETVSVDLSSRGLSGLGYRAGVYHSSGVKDTSEEEGASLPIGATGGTCGRAAIFLEKEIDIWKDRRNKPQPFNLFSGLPHVTLSGIMGCMLTADTVKCGKRWSGYILNFANPRVSLDAFSSLSLSAQVGHFHRWFLDFTKLNARVNIGSSAAFVAATRNPERFDQNDALPTVEVTLEQQLYGPVRARVDCRYGMDSFSIKNGLPLQDIAYGFDWSPLSVTSLKVVVWYSPVRNEGMMEFRFFEN